MTLGDRFILFALWPGTVGLLGYDAFSDPIDGPHALAALALIVGLPGLLFSLAALLGRLENTQRRARARCSRQDELYGRKLAELTELLRASSCRKGKKQA